MPKKDQKRVETLFIIDDDLADRFISRAEIFAIEAALKTELDRILSSKPKTMRTPSGKKKD